MKNDKRKQEILELLKKNGSVKVNELSEKFKISEVTVRNYLADMEKKGLLSRVHGGAISSYKPYYSMNMTQRLETNQSEKADIAAMVASMIEPDDTVMLNSGTTTLLAFRKFPTEYNLNIVTNSVAIALEASGNPNYNVILVGGMVNTKYQFTYGNDAVKQINSYHADKLVLSVDGIAAESGLTTFYDKEAEIDEAMISRSDCHIIAADYTKFSRCAFVKIADVDIADYIVTNPGADSLVVEKLVNKGIKVIKYKNKSDINSIDL